MASIKYDKEANALMSGLHLLQNISRMQYTWEKMGLLIWMTRAYVVGFEILFPKSVPKEAEKAIIRSKDTIELVQ